MQELDVKEYSVAETLMGRDLENAKYDFPFKDLIPKQAELESAHHLVHRVVLEDFVDVETATGVVHLSPGNGEEDFFAARRRGMPVFVPFDDEVKFTAEAGVFSGVFARDTDTMVIEELRKGGLLVDVKTVRHEYPTCWRSHHKLVWLARKEYFLRTDKINTKVLGAAEKVIYFYDETKNRFISFLKEGKPWCISRERVWGAPLPVWKCEKCAAKILVSSKRELLAKAMEKPNENFELHKPWVDRLTLKCERCGGAMRREDFVLDTWHNSGASHYARFTEKEFDQYVPADFLTEGIDQTRGWAYTLLLEYVILTGRAEAPYKAFLFQGLVQDAKGHKMSKSVGNVIEANRLLDKNSADVSRFYMLRKCSPIDLMNFDVNELSRRTYQILSTLYHLNRFFLQNAEFDSFNPKDHSLEWAEKADTLKKTDMWLLSKLQKTIEAYTAGLEASEFNPALGILENFVIEDVSRLYVPMVRKELWTDDPETLHRRLSIYATLWHTLRNLTLLFNPVTPYLSEELHQKVYKRLDPTLPDSVNLDDWPKPNPKLRNNTIEDNFHTMFDLVSLVFAARQNAKLKRRWPLNKMIVVAKKKTIDALRTVEGLFLELSNTKNVEYATEVPQNMTTDRWASASEGGTSVFLDVHRDEKLIGEGLMRDLARRVQALRKELGYVPTDVLELVRVAELDAESRGQLQPYLEDLKELVRAKNVQLHISRKEAEAEWHESGLDDRKIYLAISS
jgi:isoleucyl-tRNA synthetase